MRVFSSFSFFFAAFILGRKENSHKIEISEQEIDFWISGECIACGILCAMCIMEKRKKTEKCFVISLGFAVFCLLCFCFDFAAYNNKTPFVHTFSLALLPMRCPFFSHILNVLVGCYCCCGSMHAAAQHPLPPKPQQFQRYLSLLMP